MLPAVQLQSIKSSASIPCAILSDIHSTYLNNIVITTPRTKKISSKELISFILENYGQEDGFKTIAKVSYRLMDIESYCMCLKHSHRATTTFHTQNPGY